MGGGDVDGDGQRRRAGLGGRRVSALIPNILTIGALCAGLTAVRERAADVGGDPERLGLVARVHARRARPQELRGIRLKNH